MAIKKKEKINTGRKSKLNKELIKEVCDWISKGNTFARACILSDISEAIFYAWKSQGIEDQKKNKDTIKVEFLEAVKKAEEKFKAWNIAQIMKASQDAGAWTASAWLLERKYPEEFGRREKIEFTSKLEGWIEAFDKIGKENEE